jgi:hypothetical protein
MHKPDFLGWYDIDGGHQIEYSVKGVWESTYLEFAKSDLEDGKNSRNFVNAVSNAKRALHYQVDALSKAFGWENLKERNNLPTKLEFLSKCGVAAPNIIRRVNKFRNTIEHDYYFPTEEETEEYLDIVELYLMATHKIATEFPDRPGAELRSSDDEYEKEWNYPDSIEIYFPETEGKLKIVSKEHSILDININKPEYFEWVYALVKQCVA